MTNQLFRRSIFAIALISTLCVHTATVCGQPNKSRLSLRERASFRGAKSDNKVQVFPSKVHLSTKRDRQAVVVQVIGADGQTLDVTAAAKFTLIDARFAKLNQNVLHPISDGTTELTIAYGNQSISVPVTVEDAKVERPISFKLDVMPVFMKAGCNSGSCHGASRGQNGFRLSVFGFDPHGDYHRLTREIIGRRVNLAVPEESLLLEKPTGTVTHGGGERFARDSELYAILLRWLEAGTPLDSKQTAPPVSAEVFPHEAVLESGGASQRFIMRVRYSDGTDRDVTSLAMFSSNNSVAATVSKDGVVKSGRRGEAFVMARFDKFNLGVPIIVVPKDQPFEFPDVPAHNYIDTLVYKKLKKLRIAPSERCQDEVFLRRVYLDTIGLLPTPNDYRRFLADPDPDKRAKLVDELLKRPEFTDIWVMKWAELLRINRIKGGFFNWLRQNYLANVPIDQMIRELLIAEGGFFRDPPAQYFRNVGKPRKLAEDVAQVFMGTRLQCAQCHNHPFDRWTMDDYYGFAAFFPQLGSKRNWEDTRELIVFNTGTGEVRHPTDDRVMAPKFLGGDTPKINGRDRRAVLAQWLTAPENPYFARNLANIAWSHFFGQGIVEPVDDVRVSNPPSNHELLETLGRKLIEYRYDFRKLIRDICTSRTYQLSTVASASNTSDRRNFSHAPIRRLRAEVLHDCICQATASPTRFGGFPLGTRAVQLPVSSMTNYFLKTFGRSTRETVCSCEVNAEPNLSQALHLINGETTWGKIRSGSQIRATHKEPASVIEALYVRCLTRKPTPEESARFDELLKENEDHDKLLEEIFWALLNSNEFVFNH